MAKYTISYKCGHGSYEKQLYGKETERQRYIAWAEDNMLCPDCYKTKARADDAAAEQIASIHTSSIEPVLICIVRGRIEANQDALRALGFEWQRIDTGAFALLATKLPPKSFAVVKTLGSLAEGEKWVEEMARKLSAIGYRMEIAATALDLSFVARTLERRQAAMSANPKPARPAWYQALRDATPNATWNGKVYGKAGAWKIYISNVEHQISDAQKAELDTYQAELTAYRKAQEAL